VRRRDEFLRAWIKRTQIRLVSPSGLIDHREELEVDLVQPPGEVNGKGLTVASRHNPSHETIWETPFQKVCRTAVQPVFVQIEVACYPIPRYAQ